jgi:hypothetical protein
MNDQSARVIVVTTFQHLNWMSRLLVLRRMYNIETEAQNLISGYLWSANVKTRSGIISITAWDSRESVLAIGKVDSHVLATRWLRKLGGSARSECYDYLGHYTLLFDLTSFADVRTT